MEHNRLTLTGTLKSKKNCAGIGKDGQISAISLAKISAFNCALMCQFRQRRGIKAAAFLFLNQKKCIMV
jgi:hypothetical protein